MEVINIVKKKKTKAQENNQQNKPITNKNNKFTIEIGNNVGADERLLTDELIQYLKNSKTPLLMIKKLNDFLKNEEYDSDSIQNDLEEEKSSNIGLKVNKEAFDVIQDFEKNAVALRMYLYMHFFICV